jgi:hypothetical protein
VAKDEVAPIGLDLWNVSGLQTQASDVTKLAPETPRGSNPYKHIN